MPSKISALVIESARPRYTSPLNITGSFLFMSDIEIPFHNATFINQVFEVAKRYSVGQLVIGGDFLHFESFSPFLGGSNDVDEEVSEIEKYLPAFLSPFKHIAWFMGNHDDRPKRAVQRKVSAVNSLRIILSKELAGTFNKKVVMSEYYWCTAGSDWQLEHQKDVNAIPTKAAQALSAKYHKNIITAHTHKAGIVKYNGFWAIDSGCAVDADRLAYTSLRHSSGSAMQNGAVLMIWRKNQYVPIHLTPDRMEFELWRARK